VKILILIISLIVFNSCTLLDGAYKLVQDNVEVSWKFDPTKPQKIVDSIVVKSEPSYYIYDITDLQEGEDFAVIKNGYTIWQLRTGNRIRIEVQKQDTIIYIYKNEDKK
jgi:hypothetical protein